MSFGHCRLLTNNFYPVLFIGTLNKQLQICKVDSAGNVIGGQPGCYNLIPVFDWIRRCIVSIFLVFGIAFLPLFLQGNLLSLSVNSKLSFCPKNSWSVELARLCCDSGNISFPCPPSSKYFRHRYTLSPSLAI